MPDILLLKPDNICTTRLICVLAKDCYGKNAFLFWVLDFKPEVEMINYIFKIIFFYLKQGSSS